MLEKSLINLDRSMGSDQGNPLNYGTIQINYKKAQRRAGLKCSGTHVLRHGMAKLARRVGGGLDAVIAMTGHKDLKLADHYSKLDHVFQKEVSEKIVQTVKIHKAKDTLPNNVISLFKKTGVYNEPYLHKRDDFTFK